MRHSAPFACLLRAKRRPDFDTEQVLAADWVRKKRQPPPLFPFLFLKKNETSFYFYHPSLFIAIKKSPSCPQKSKAPARSAGARIQKSFWTSLCWLSRTKERDGGFDFPPCGHGLAVLRLEGKGRRELKTHATTHAISPLQNGDQKTCLHPHPITPKNPCKRALNISKTARN